MIIDCHSFPSVALPYELDQREERADFCIGTDAFHTPAVIRDTMVTAVKEAGYSVAVDAPFAGALVPLSCYRKDDRVLSVMIEVNRRLYMDEQSGRKTREFDEVHATVGRLIEDVAETGRTTPGG
jgi:N-formylglutamate amidohydrolase